MICGESEGLLRKLENKEKEGQFIHLRCLRFVPELYNNETDKSIGKSINSNNKKGGNKDLEVNHKPLSNIIRKWRLKTACKLCKDTDLKKTNQGLVIKCTNTKCKSYYHIPCAINKGMIISLDFMTDYYGFTSAEKFNQAIPFYCNNHNRNLIEAYTTYTDQLDQVINIEENMTMSNDKGSTSNLSFSKHKTDEDEQEGENVCCITEIPPKNNENISNLQHPEFKFERTTNMIDDDALSIKSIPTSNKIFENKCNNYTNISTQEVITTPFISPKVQIPDIEAIPLLIKKDTFCEDMNPEKPKYKNEDLSYPLPDFNLITNDSFPNFDNENLFEFGSDIFPKESTFPKIEIFEDRLDTHLQCPNVQINNFQHFSKMFYDYIDKDISRINKQGKSNFSDAQIKDLKDFIIKIIKNYKNFDSGLSTLYQILIEKKVLV